MQNIFAKKQSIFSFSFPLLLLPICLSLTNLTFGQVIPFLHCDSSSDTPFLRNEGRTEQIGDFRLLCSGGTPGVTGTSNVQIFLNAAVTNRILNSGTNAVDAFLFIGEPTTAVLGTNLFQGTLSGQSSIAFSNVPFTGSSTPVIYRITNVRADITNRPTLQGPKAAQLLAFVSASSPGPGGINVPISQPQAIVGFVVPSQTMQI